MREESYEEKECQKKIVITMKKKEERVQLPAKITMKYQRPTFNY